MIVRLTGTLVEVGTNSVVLDVGGVGYELGVSSTTLASLPATGDVCSLFVRMVVRDDAITLFGFARPEERTIFDKLCAVSGVGPKNALAITSTFSVEEVAHIALTGDTKRMTLVRGIGNKTANRLILELQDVFKKNADLANLAATSTPEHTHAASASASDATTEARAALLSMGFTIEEADLALEGIDGQTMSVQNILSAALRRLGGGR